MPGNNWIMQCECGKDVDREGYHLLTCKVGGGPVWEHNMILSGWGECLEELQICHHKEPRNRYAESEGPDIVFFDLESGHDVELDISLAHPWSLDTIRQAGQEDGYAALKREGKKMEKYGHEVLLCGSKPDLIPLVFEHFGHWGKSVELFISPKIGREVQICWGCQVCGRIHYRLEKTIICFITELQQQSNLEEDCSPFSRTFRNGQI